MESERFSVIIPTLNEARNISRTVKRIRELSGEAEIIVCDGGSVDGTLDQAEKLGVSVVGSLRGRGTQCNAGAAEASGDILFFHHADARLPDGAFSLMNEFFRCPKVRIGTFMIQFDRRHWALRLYRWFQRFNTFYTRFGDNGIVIRRDFFKELGGFPEWPLFEDVEILRKARRLAAVYTFPDYMTVSSRMFITHGMIRQQLRAVFLYTRFRLGGSPKRLYERYYC